MIGLLASSELNLLKALWPVFRREIKADRDCVETFTVGDAGSVASTVPFSSTATVVGGESVSLWLFELRSC